MTYSSGPVKPNTLMKNSRLFSLGPRVGTCEKNMVKFYSVQKRLNFKVLAGHFVWLDGWICKYDAMDICVCCFSFMSNNKNSKEIPVDYFGFFWLLCRWWSLSILLMMNIMLWNLSEKKASNLGKIIHTWSSCVSTFISKSSQEHAFIKI